MGRVSGVSSIADTDLTYPSRQDVEEITGNGAKTDFQSSYAERRAIKFEPIHGRYPTDLGGTDARLFLDRAAEWRATGHPPVAAAYPRLIHRGTVIIRAVDGFCNKNPDKIRTSERESGRLRVTFVPVRGCFDFLREP